MKSFTIHEKPEPAPDRLDRAEALVFVKDGFNVLAFVLGPVWMIMNRLWLVLFAYLVIYALFELMVSLLGLSQMMRGPMLLGLNLLIGFEADSLRRWTLDQRGWTTVGTVSGENVAVCERRFFENWVPRTPVLDGGYVGSGTNSPPPTYTPTSAYTPTSTYAPSSDASRYGRGADGAAGVGSAPQGNLGPTAEPKPRMGQALGGWFGGWRSGR